MSVIKGLRKARAFLQQIAPSESTEQDLQEMIDAIDRAISRYEHEADRLKKYHSPLPENQTTAPENTPVKEDPQPAREKKQITLL